MSKLFAIRTCIVLVCQYNGLVVDHSYFVACWEDVSLYVSITCPRSIVLHTLCPPAMVLFFLFLFVPLFAALLLTVYIVLCKPGCAVSAADTSSV